MIGGFIALLFAAIVSILVGAYITFIEGDSMGAVFMCVGAVFAALASMRAGQIKKGKDDAG